MTCNSYKIIECWSIIFFICVYLDAYFGLARLCFCVLYPSLRFSKCFVDQIGVEARKAIHIGDDEKADRDGANAVGIDCW